MKAASHRKAQGQGPSSVPSLQAAAPPSARSPAGPRAEAARGRSALEPARRASVSQVAGVDAGALDARRFACRRGALRSRRRFRPSTSRRCAWRCRCPRARCRPRASSASRSPSCGRAEAGRSSRCPSSARPGVLLAITYSIREGRRGEFFDLMRELKPMLHTIGGGDVAIYEDRSRPNYLMEVFRFKDEIEFTAFDDKFHKDRKIAAIYALLDDIVEAEKSDFKIFERRLSRGGTAVSPWTPRVARPSESARSRCRAWRWSSRLRSEYASGPPPGGPMARGFESKSVADQQESAQARRVTRRLGPEPSIPCSPRASRRLELARADVARRLADRERPGAPPDARAGAARARRRHRVAGLRRGATRGRAPRVLALCAARRRRTASRRRAPRVADYDIRVQPRRRREDARRRRAHHLAQPGERAGRRALVPPLPERVQELREHVLPRVGRPAARRPHARRGLGLHRREVGPRARTASTSRPARPLRAARRRQRRRPHRLARAAARRPCRRAAAIELDVEFQAKLPRVFARTGYFRDYFLVGQWFPKLAVYEPAGLRGRAAAGWNCHQFHANSEFYADFGRYRVEITLPKGYVVGATGTRTRAPRQPRRDRRPTSSSAAT